MGLLTIQTPKAHKASTPAVGIDLGTTHSLVALYREKNMHIISDNQEELMPSVVRYLSSGNVVVGQCAKSEQGNDPINTIASAKRLLGRQEYIETNFHKVSPIEVSAEILKCLLTRAQTVDPSIHQAVITVPAYFDETQRQATKRAAELAGIDVLRLLNEPTAAAIAYGLDKAASGRCLVFDLGGGTFDVSLLNLKNGLFEVIATGGDTQLGGDDMDALLLKHANLANLMTARELKEALSLQEEASGITRSEFNTLIKPLVEKTIHICQHVLRDAKMSINDIESVILVGGATRVPLVRQRVREFFQKEPLCSIDPDKVVAMGAAIQASVLSGFTPSDDLLLLDVTPLSLGVEMMGGLVEKIILRNTPIPAVASELFTTYADDQTGLILHVVQGERESVEDCRSLAHFELNGIPPMPAGKARIEVTFRMDADGLLQVEAKELTSGVRSEIVVKPTFGLTHDIVTDCVEDSLRFEKEDGLKRKLKQKTTEADKLLKSIEKALVQLSKHLTSEEVNAIGYAHDALVKAVQDADVRLIENELAKLEPLAQQLAERQLNLALKRALEGKSLAEIETVLL